MQRTEIPEIPMDAIREALLNSFCHKEYDTGQSNEVAIFKNRVEIYNPGAFPEGFEPEDFIKRSERPIRRNPKIARILYYSKDIESFGTGLKRIADACERANVRYDFTKLKSGFVVCFYRDERNSDNMVKGSTGKLEKSTGKTEKSTGKTEKSTGKLEKSTGKLEKISNNLNNSQKKVIEYLSSNEKITNRDVQILLNVKSSRALKVLKELVDKNIIEKQGKYRDCYYVMKKAQNDYRR